MQHGPSMHKGTPKNIVSYEIALQSKRQIAEGTFAFTFEKPAGFHYAAGQHAQVSLIHPSETDSEGNGRLLSFASTPEESSLTFAMRMRDTAFKRVLGRMKVGEKVRLRMRLGKNPHGSFALHGTDPTRPAVFLIGGIGIVPAFSIIKEALGRNQTYPIILFYSNRRPEDAPFLAELTELAKQHPSFTLVATMTDPETAITGWQGETGRINEALLKRYVDSLRSPLYYIAGLTPMTAAMQTMLARAGVKKDSIRAEEFEGFDMMNHPEDTAPRHTRNRHVPIAMVGLLLLIAIPIIHAQVGTSLSQAHTGILSVFPLGVLILWHTVALALGAVLFTFFILPKLRSMASSHKR